MSNALKFSHAGSNIWLRTTSTPSPHSSDELRVTIEVQDEGCGITAADAKKIFKKEIEPKKEPELVKLGKVKKVNFIELNKQRLAQQ